MSKSIDKIPKPSTAVKPKTEECAEGGKTAPRGPRDHASGSREPDGVVLLTGRPRGRMGRDPADHREPAGDGKKRPAAGAVRSSTVVDRRKAQRSGGNLVHRCSRSGRDGSSARGAMKGWERHGVCTRTRWPDDLHGAKRFDQTRADEAVLTPGGAYYRVDFRQVRDVHAAIHEVGIVYATLMVQCRMGKAWSTHDHAHVGWWRRIVQNTSRDRAERQGRRWPRDCPRRVYLPRFRGPKFMGAGLGQKRICLAAL